MWRRQEAALALLSAASEASRSTNAPYIKPLGEGRLRLDSSAHVYPLLSRQNEECLSVGVEHREKRFLPVDFFLSNLFYS